MKNKNELRKESYMWIAIAIGLFLIFGFFGFNKRGYGMMEMMYGSYGYGMMFFGWVFGALVTVALVLLIIWLFKQITKRR
jgi:uncharacterized membrane protein